ncbi:MAG: hypothetical protein ACOY81_00225 [Bacillota bacterium]|uniref:hypothetical protein n=1 Tax=Desulfurispora thermophila TaxID=265470 RepID=UPI000381457B|nr:hypothetical protein [Desulfurispora thermophila]
MTEREFISLFNQHKKMFLALHGADGTSALTLNRFEEWLKSRLQGDEKKGAGRRRARIAPGIYLQQVMELVRKKLQQEHNICLRLITLGASWSVKETSKCATVFNESNIYYRLGRTRPRKGEYSGRELVVFELVMDGHKHNVFLPMLTRLDELSGKVGYPVERELPRLEATGKYRFKLLFPCAGEDDAELPDIFFLAEKIAAFVSSTVELLTNLGVK